MIVRIMQHFCIIIKFKSIMGAYCHFSLDSGEMLKIYHISSCDEYISSRKSYSNEEIRYAKQLSSVIKGKKWK